jgi:hypothetical protein
MFKTLVNLSLQLFFDDRKIYEIAALSASEQWASARTYTATSQAPADRDRQRRAENGERSEKPRSTRPAAASFTR